MVIYIFEAINVSLYFVDIFLVNSKGKFVAILRSNWCGRGLYQ